LACSNSSWDNTPLSRSLASSVSLLTTSSPAAFVGGLLLLRGLVLCMPVYRVCGRGRSSGDHCRPAGGAEQTRPTSSSHLLSLSHQSAEAAAATAASTASRGTCTCNAT